MNAYIIYLQYQSDDRCENTYRAYMKTDNESEVEDAILNLPNFDNLEQMCIDDYKDYFDEDYEEEDQYASVCVENLKDVELDEDDEWFQSLEILIDERDLSSK